MFVRGCIVQAQTDLIVIKMNVSCIGFGSYGRSNNRLNLHEDFSH